MKQWLIASALILATSGVVFSQAGPPTGRPSPRGQQQPEQPKPVEPEPQIIGTEQSPFVVRVVPTAETQRDRINRESERIQNETFNRRALWINGVIALFTFGMLVVAFTQWRTYQAQMSAMKAIERGQLYVSHVATFAGFQVGESPRLLL